MNIEPLATRVARRASFWLAAGLCLLISHDAIFLVQHGPGQSVVAALRQGGHAYWGLASAVLLVGGALAAAGWIWRLRALRSRAPRGRATPGPAEGWVRRAAAAWIRLFVLVVMAFAVQENVEHLAGHGHGIGLGAVVGPEYPLALPVLAVATALGAVVIALVRRHEAELLQRLTGAPAWTDDAPPTNPRPPYRTVGFHSTPMSAHGALRAPPGSPALTIG